LESEQESTSEDSDEDPEIVQKMAMLSNRLQYLAKKNKKFMSRGSSHKSSRKEEQKGSAAKAMFTSLCSNYEGNKKVREAKATMLVHQYELFRIKEDEDIETMYSRFQTVVSGHQILKKIYVAE